jgi:solute:Na+ symporter, SSS family
LPLAFTGYDWAVLGVYVALLALAAWWSTRRTIAGANEYFLAGHHAPVWLVAVSVVSTMQSAATFLGAPDNSFRGDYSYLTSNFAAIIAALLLHNTLSRHFCVT